MNQQAQQELDPEGMVGESLYAIQYKHVPLMPALEVVPPNPSGLEPLGQAVLVEVWQPERKVGKIALPESVREKESMVEVRCRVIAIGPDAWHGEPRPRCQVGDLVLVSKFAGFYVSKEVSADGKEYRIVNGRDIFLKITEKQNG